MCWIAILWAGTDLCNCYGAFYINTMTVVNKVINPFLQGIL